MPQRGKTGGIPEGYLSESIKKGSVVEISYASRHYAGDESSINKKAYVYLPYGYNDKDTKTRYNIFYMMHGLGETADSFFSYGGGYAKNLLDNMIEKGNMPPVIVVAATFDAENAPQRMSRSDSEVRQFHRDFLNDLMPAVEGRFHTYAAGTSAAAFAASRDHRAFGGFSLGAVTTWFEFCYNADYIRYFLPMSCSCWYYGGYGDYKPKENADLFEKVIAEHNLNTKGYFIYACTGTNDTEQGQVDLLMDEMLKRPAFRSADNVVYYKKDGGMHNMNAGFEYIYNALPLFFNDISAEDAVFYNIYSNFERMSDPLKAETGLYYFKGNPGGPFVICVEGSGTKDEFVRGSGFSQAYTLSKSGYNAFALRCRSDEKSACADLSRAISLVIDNASMLGVSKDNYILWGGPKGKKTVNSVNKNGTAAYGAGEYPKAGQILTGG